MNSINQNTASVALGAEPVRPLKSKQLKKLRQTVASRAHDIVNSMCVIPLSRRDTCFAVQHVILEMIELRYGVESYRCLPAEMFQSAQDFATSARIPTGCSLLDAFRAACRQQREGLH